MADNTNPLSPSTIVQNGAVLSASNPLPTSAVLAAGTAIIGNVSIDQTTPGTTNGVQVNAALPAGANTIGAVTPAAAAAGGYSYVHIAAGQATTVIKASAGTLHSIVLNSAALATNVTTVYDNPSVAGTVIAIPNVVAATVPSTLIFDIAFATGLTIITTTANGGDMTVCYK